MRRVARIIVAFPRGIADMHVCESKAEIFHCPPLIYVPHAQSFTDLDVSIQQHFVIIAQAALGYPASLLAFGIGATGGAHETKHNKPKLYWSHHYKVATCYPKFWYWSALRRTSGDNIARRVHSMESIVQHLAGFRKSEEKSCKMNHTWFCGHLKPRFHFGILRRKRETILLSSHGANFTTKV
jgi:hypothetical protein